MQSSLPALGILITALAALGADPAKTVPPGTPVTITVVPGTPAAPPVSINLLSRHAQAVPIRQGFTHTGGGNTDVSQPSPDVVQVTMTGVSVAGAHPCKDSAASLTFDLRQEFEVSFDKPEVKAAKVTLEARLIGLLRSHCKGGGSAEVGKVSASVGCGDATLLTLSVPDQGVAGGENQAINLHEGPEGLPVRAGRYCLHITCHIGASHTHTLFPCKTASAEFAPDPALDPLWISAWEPFHGAQKKDFGLQVVLKVAQEEVKEENGKEDKKNQENGQAITKEKTAKKEKGQNQTRRGEQR